MSDFETFEEELPIKEKFYSLLIGKKVGDYEYEHVLKIQDKFQMKTMKDCHNFHLKCDALLLADVFEKFRNKSLIKNYVLLLSHYLKAPALSSQTMLNITKVEIEFIQDCDMQFFFEKGMRGRVSYISDNKYLKSYDPKYVIYLYANNLYGYAMPKFLLTSGFKQINPKEFELSNVLAIVQKVVSQNLILSILKNYMNYIMIILQLQIKQKSKKEMLSKDQLMIADVYNIPISNITKLMSNFIDKENYVLHYVTYNFT